MRVGLLFVIPLVAVGCGGQGTGFGDDAGQGGDSPFATDSGGGGDGPQFQEAGPQDGGPVDSGPTTEIDFVYAHSPLKLYKVDPVAKTMTVVGAFTGFDGNDLGPQVIDIAIDANNDGYATTYGGLYKLDLKTAKLTSVHMNYGGYPNSLSFVPAGTLDPNVEALVGYNGPTYVRIDPANGNVTAVGGLKDNYASSGDIVSVKNGGTFLTVTGGPNNCGDCLLQIDPKTGAMIQDYGDIKHSAVYGLAFWAGTAYGFDDGGQLFSIGWANNKLVTTDIPTTKGLEFWGAGSTTSAPPKDADGGGIPVN